VIDEGSQLLTGEMQIDLIKEVVIEHIARTTLARIRPQWCPMAALYEQGHACGLLGEARGGGQAIWGDPIDPMDALAEFDERDLSEPHVDGWRRPLISVIHSAFGPFISVGIRIGLDAAEKLKADPRGLSVVYYILGMSAFEPEWTLIIGDVDLRHRI
jgi:hypothetical protein